MLMKGNITASQTYKQQFNNLSNLCHGSLYVQYSGSVSISIKDCCVLDVWYLPYGMHLLLWQCYIFQWTPIYVNRLYMSQIFEVGEAWCLHELW